MNHYLANAPGADTLQRLQRGARFFLGGICPVEGVKDMGQFNAGATGQLAQATGLQVIASGGVAGLEDVRRLQAWSGIVGVVIGLSLYEGRIELAEALQLNDSRRPTTDNSPSSAAPRPVAKP